MLDRMSFREAVAMQIHFVLGLSVVLQFTVAGLAFLLIRYTERRFAWGLITSAIILMATRRCITLYRLLSQDVSKLRDLPDGRGGGAA